VPVSFGVRHLAPLVADFITTYPGVTLDIDFNDRQVNLIESGLDMAIRITTQLDPTQVARRISTSRLLTLASPEYLARHGRPRTPADLAAHQCLGYTGTARATWPYRVDGEMQWVPVVAACRPTAAMPCWMPASAAWASPSAQFHRRAGHPCRPP
jgi:DNA-binding transcriptional LysR family regulator